ncbi:hypothetical protein SPHINGO8AM_30524 [Sphingomonas sp. 8AM]|nr:hypothetical protein SPHINGO8AM_30524 [Sphingomonas sp. 8AM]
MTQLWSVEKDGLLAFIAQIFDQWKRLRRHWPTACVATGSHPA